MTSRLVAPRSVRGTGTASRLMPEDRPETSVIVALVVLEPGKYYKARRLEPAQAAFKVGGLNSHLTCSQELKNAYRMRPTCFFRHRHEQCFSPANERWEMFAAP